MNFPHDEPHAALDPELRRAFAEPPVVADDAAFVTGVMRRVARLQRFELAWQAAQGVAIALFALALTPWVVEGTLWSAERMAATPSAVVDVVLTPIGALAALAFAGWRLLEGRDALR